MATRDGDPTGGDPTGGDTATGLGRCAWGIGLVMLDFHVGVDGRSVDLLPDVVGALLLVVGLANLGRPASNQHLAWAGVLAWPLAAVALVSLAVDLDPTSSSAVRFGLSVATGALGLAIALTTSLFAADEAERGDAPELAALTRHRAGLFVLTWVTVLGVTQAAGALDPEAPAGMADAALRTGIGAALAWALLAGVVTTLLVAGAMARVARLVAGGDGSTPLVTPRSTRAAVVVVAVGGLLATGYLSFTDTDGGAPPVVDGNTTSYPPAWDSWRLVDAADSGDGDVLCDHIYRCGDAPTRGGSACRFEGRLRLSSGGDDFLVRRDVGGEIWGIVYHSDVDHPDGPAEKLALEPLEVGWWWKARGAVVDVARRIPCDTARLRVVVNLDRQFSQTADLALRPGPDALEKLGLRLSE